MDTLSWLESKALEGLSERPRSDTTLEMIGVFAPTMRMMTSPQLITMPYLTVQLSAGSTGFCFIKCNEWDATADADFLGLDAVEQVTTMPHYLRIATLDALYGLLPKTDCEFRYLPPVSATQKSRRRAEILVKEGGVGPESRVAILGVVPEIVECCLEITPWVYLADLDYCDQSCFGLPIQSDYASVLRKGDIALITGNVVKTGTLASCLNAAKESGTRVCFFAMSGHNFAPEYLRLGAEVVVSEDFPFYAFAGLRSQMRVYRLDQNMKELEGEHDQPVLP